MISQIGELWWHPTFWSICLPALWTGNQKQFFTNRHGRSVYDLSEMWINTGMTDHVRDRNLMKHSIKWRILKRSSLISSPVYLLSYTELSDYVTGENEMTSRSTSNKAQYVVLIHNVNIFGREFFRSRTGFISLFTFTHCKTNKWVDNDNHNL